MRVHFLPAMRFNHHGNACAFAAHRVNLQKSQKNAAKTCARLPRG
jgi:hypothetical protein